MSAPQTQEPVTEVLGLGTQPAPSTVIFAFTALFAGASVLAAVAAQRSAIELVSVLATMVMLGAVCGSLFAYLVFNHGHSTGALLLRALCGAASMLLLCLAAMALIRGEDWPYTWLTHSASLRTGPVDGAQ